jgi:hypothetical protein
MRLLSFVIVGTPPRIWADGRVDRDTTVNGPTETGKGEMSDKIMILHDTISN